ncbi:MAG: hypothetical protein C0487_19170 [Leptothrix sp. (in: Bacteria)]|nr:hypothetical protein [Leptothrix sp. (in: b-proteobacteria)]
MKVLSTQEVSQVSGGESLIDAIHRAEYNAYGVPLINAGIYVINLFSTTKIPYVTKQTAP